ncbi:carbohydrate-binding domain-containing protein [bacterium]|nr:carbohydrate-binding domain-containing protein [bacterium]
MQLVLNNLSISNTDFPCIYIKSADKTFITTAKGSENYLEVTE